MNTACVWCGTEMEVSDNYPGAIILHFCNEECIEAYEAVQEPRPTPEEQEREYYRKRHTRRRGV